MKKIFYSVLMILAVSACSGIKQEPAGKPMSDEDMRREARGRLTGDDGIILSGGPKKDDSASPIGVNSFLWRATLDTISFMPLVSADPFGGVIITDWYEDPKTPGERFKANVLILDRTLRADGVKLTLFKQKYTGGKWRDTKVDKKLERTLEDTILTRARQMKVDQLQ
ncbi:MAG: DUF3576 domain-containing protein [Rickettsiales bacterium]